MVFAESRRGCKLTPTRTPIRLVGWGLTTLSAQIGHIVP